MPGDELESKPTFLATRAATIEGTPETIWPWLVPIGYGRAGFYGYGLLENLGSPRGVRSTDRVLPEFQHFAVGDEMPISAAARAFLSAVQPWFGACSPGDGGSWERWPGRCGRSPGTPPSRPGWYGCSCWRCLGRWSRPDFGD